MNQEQLRAFIRKRKQELEELTDMIKGVERLHEEVGLSELTLADIRIKTSGRMAYLERSIRDHKKLLKLK